MKKIESLNKDIASLEKALKIVEQTENYLHFNKSSIMMELCEQINVLKDKRDKTLDYINSITN
jgi:uncharacterized protein (DUF1499 family)